MRLIDADCLKQSWVYGDTDRSGKTKVVEVEDIERQITVDPTVGIVSEKLGMTLCQMETEIEFMREFDKFMQEKVEAYDWICRQFSREITERNMREAGMSEEEIKEICDEVEKEMEK